ncbi:dehydrogenase [Acetobacter nitrogenifigens DSM 23921 = NBRC 105050]|uniref:Short-chain dehydrogenase n=1 Tax=Acetobacter nitrogenifigens DSM 23921 = NBRC 105050 TaxID=1120919 RepID=A0A511X995_9PROT|nr:SDR family oxidoreductase [Acetobacter nitrogenifigens]GBQ93224.1 dehydrogenase [Acetobacter nitrogenifigens DSM 23921 = NBRC 105050]GEN59504.1 short-chain dehydrogenase [Acetobacter nitrogenifigens DSM 23921 = NBRC 105050]
MSLNRKTLVVIGGTSGFGKALAERAAALGASLVVTGRDAAKLSQVVDEFSGRGFRVKGHIVDASNEDSLASFFESVPSFDHLVSMAGGFMGGGFLGADYETIYRAVDEKLFANLRIARYAAAKVGAGGSMVFTAGAGGRPDNASGAIVGNDAIRLLVQGLAVELAPNARVNAVAPTWTETPLWRNMPPADVQATKERFAKAIPMGRTATIDEVVQVYLFLMRCGFITGQTIIVDGGLTLVT